MSSIEPGWYVDPADRSTQRYWDGGGWLGEPIPADATPPAGPPPSPPPAAATTTVSPKRSEKPSDGAPAQSPSSPAGPTGAPTPTAPPVGPPVPPPGWPAGYPYPLTKHGPPPQPHGHVLAGGGSRFVARIVDVIMVLLLCVVANAWFAVQFWRGIAPLVQELWARSLAGNRSTEGIPIPPESTSTLLWMMLLATTAVWFAYEVPASANSGQTLGKRLLGIKVMRVESDERLGFGRSFRRWGRLGLPTLLWYCWGIGFLLQFIDCLFVAFDRPLRQALHDKSAATVVVQVQRRHENRGGRHADSR